MKLLGPIGGVSPQSTEIYYRLLNDAVQMRLGPQHSASILLYTLDYGVMIGHYDDRNCPAFIAEVVKGAEHLKAAGVEALVICSNTTHVGADAAAKATGLPVLQILDVLAGAMDKAGVIKPLLIGTPVVMNGDHYISALSQRYKGEAVVPSSQDQDVIGRIILDELVKGDVREPSRQALQTIFEKHVSDGANGVDGVILGCTELCMILSQDDCATPVFDTTSLHAAAVSALALEEG